MVQYTLRQLEYFVAVAEAGSVTKAAQAIHLSQSALSTALVELERSLDVQLFLRHHARGVTLTPAGEQMLTASRRLLHQAAELADDARGLGDEVTGTLHLGCYGAVAPYVLPALLAEASVRLPSLEINSGEVDLAQLADGVAGGRFELGIGYDLTVDARLDKQSLYTLRPYVLLPAGHRLARRKKVKLAELAEEPMAVLDLPQSREYFANLFESLGLDPSVRFRSSSTETVRAIVAEGLAYTVLNNKPRKGRGAGNPQVVAVDIADDVPLLDVILIQASGIRPTRRMRAVQQLVLELVSKGSIGSM